MNVHKKTHIKLGEDIVPRNSRHEGMEKACASVEAASKTVIYAIYLFAACIQLLYGKQGNILAVACASPEFFAMSQAHGR